MDVNCKVGALLVAQLKPNCVAAQIYCNIVDLMLFFSFRLRVCSQYKQNIFAFNIIS